MLAPKRALSVEEWLELDEDERGELVNGLLEEEEVPDPVHELAVSWIIGVFPETGPSRGDDSDEMGTVLPIVPLEF